MAFSDTMAFSTDFVSGFGVDISSFFVVVVVS